MIKLLNRFLESVLILIATLVFGLFLSKSYIYNNEVLIKSTDPLMSKFLKRIKLINKFRFIAYLIIGPFILLMILSIVTSLLF
ncbi:hypothetical protein [Mammaliicoccus sciuri]|uniref:hypothetical protein n=1 Tax=Mammaliicoccus sciuri TaxID=1296 RepID=UPI000E6A3A43|nr:hypothetical protein [Mammaliicoccus sciuri]RIN92415.1 hypothetical protein BU003_02180 [Mammaliicoccus sciuri]